MSSLKTFHRRRLKIMMCVSQMLWFHSIKSIGLLPTLLPICGIKSTLWWVASGNEDFSIPHWSSDFVVSWHKRNTRYDLVISTQVNVNLSFLVLTDVRFRIHPANTHPEEKMYMLKEWRTCREAYSGVLCTQMCCAIQQRRKSNRQRKKITAAATGS